MRLSGACRRISSLFAVPPSRVANSHELEDGLEAEVNHVLLEDRHSRKPNVPLQLQGAVNAQMCRHGHVMKCKALIRGDRELPCSACEVGHRFDPPRPVGGVLQAG